MAAGSQVVLDTILPTTHRDEAGGDYAKAVAASHGDTGEPWQCTPDLDELASWLRAAGWQVTQQTPEANAAPHTSGRTIPACGR